MIVSGGVSIYPAEIEAMLVAHAAVAAVAVFGIPTDAFGVEVKAARGMTWGCGSVPRVGARHTVLVDR